MMDPPTIAAIATPGGRGGIGIIKISGSRAVLIATAIFSSARQQSTANPENPTSSQTAPGSAIDSHRLYYGHIIDPDSGRIVDEVLLSVMRAPRSYTREDVVEINAHGGQAALNAILELVCRQGARLADPGEFTRRAFLNGRIDLTQAEAVIDIINARTDKSLQVATAQVEGKLRRSVEQIREFLIELLARAEAAIDFPDDVEEIAAPERTAAEVAARVVKPLRALIRHHVEGRVLREGLRVAVAGRPNVGKSSLLNILVQKERAIVTDLPGTTRDMIEESLNINGYPVILSDTAGLHDTDDPIETLGIEKTIENINGADLVLFTVEANCPVTAEDYSVFEQIRSKSIIIVINKIDLINGNEIFKLPAAWGNIECVHTSALYDRGIDHLKDQIIELAFGQEPLDLEAVIVPNMRQKLLLEDSLGAAEDICRGLNNGTPMELVATHFQEAIETLGQILGTNVKVDLLEQIFSRFCIGK
ncbi:MAG: tRNA uridine-5-carboxymethylaminomethyl(34) synthesis GTPase MnmE [Desulfobacteraceae bacterium]|jgi:tRNA modification GTPase|nr:tRNA uridine-5-carboxymethylaminomethyl(34) synthesis GTPase MnmE [Desulfobacteraceae bacterium]